MPNRRRCAKHGERMALGLGLISAAAELTAVSLFIRIIRRSVRKAMNLAPYLRH